jgi:hypothetical protein
VSTSLIVPATLASTVSSWLRRSRLTAAVASVSGSRPFTPTRPVLPASAWRMFVSDRVAVSTFGSVTNAAARRAALRS